MVNPRSGTMIDERYRLDRKIGTGGMADVWLAEDTELDRQVAIKILHDRFAQDKEFVQRFQREAQSAAGLQHPNVVGVFDRGSFRDTYFIAMEYVDGPSLKELVKGGMGIKDAIDFTRQILKAARFAHRKGIVHRDLKPQNVLIDDEGRARVADFGIARAGENSDITATGSVMGTAQYISPEQAQGKPTTPRSDIYSIGVILYEALTGRVPFEGDSAVAVALKQVSETPRRPSAINPNIPPALDAVVMRALAKDPDARFKDADAFLKALDAAEKAPDQPRAQDTAAYAAVSPEGEADLGEEEEYEEWEVRRRGPRWRWIALALLAMGVAGLVAFALTRPSQVAVPDVIGQNVEQATQLLDSKGFDAAIKAVPSGAPRNQVVEQDPIPTDRGGGKVEGGVDGDAQRQLRAGDRRRAERRQPEPGRRHKTPGKRGFQGERHPAVLEVGAARARDRHVPAGRDAALHPAAGDPADLPGREHGAGAQRRRPDGPGGLERPRQRRALRHRGAAGVDRASGQGPQPEPGARQARQPRHPGHDLRFQRRDNCARRHRPAPPDRGQRTEEGGLHGRR